MDLELLSNAQTSNCRTAAGRDDRLAKACWAGGALQVYLKVEGRDSGPGGRPACGITVGRRRRDRRPRSGGAFKAITDPNDWTHDGSARGLKVIDRTFTKAEARYIPNGPDSTADMAHPDPDRRPRRVLLPALPVRRGDPGHADRPVGVLRPARLRARRPGPRRQRQHARDVPRRRQGTSPRGPSTRARSTSRRPSRSCSGSPSRSRARVACCSRCVKGGTGYKPIDIVGLNDFHGQLDPTTLVYDSGISATVGGAAQLATWFDEEFASLRRPGLLLAAGDNVGASPPNSGLLEDMPTIDVENAWGLDATSLGNHEFDYGVDRLKEHIARANFPFLASNVVETATGQIPPWLDGASAVFNVNGTKVGVIGAELQETPELVSAGATAGLTFLDEGPRIHAESVRLQKQGVKVQLVVIHEGTSAGATPPGSRPPAALDRTDPLDRRPAPGHDDRRDGRRPHPPHLEPPVREVPDRRGHQRRRRASRSCS